MTPRLACPALAVLLAACSSSDVPDPGVSGTPAGVGGATASSSGPGGGGPGSGTGGAAGGGGDACEVNELPLLVTEDGNIPSRLHVPVQKNGEDGVFLFDTGSSTTFLLLGEGEPDYVRDAGQVTIGCRTVTLDGRGGLAPHEDEFGLPVFGFLGVDFMLGGTTLLDTEAALMAQHPPGTTLPGTDAWPVVDYDDVEGFVIAPVTLDGEPVRLMFDTGAPHILWLGEEGKPGDQEVTTQDALGNVITLYYGSVELEMAGRGVIEVPVLRAPSFPYFEQTVASLGGNIHGLLGLSALRGRSMVVEGDAEQARVGPVP